MFCGNVLVGFRFRLVGELISWGWRSSLIEMNRLDSSGILWAMCCELSENRYTYLIIDVFRAVILLLLVSTGNNVRASFLVHQVPHTSATVLRYRQVFT